MFAMLTSVATFTCGKPLHHILQAIKVTASKLGNGRIRITLPDEEPDIEELELQGTPLCDQKFGSMEVSRGIQ
ncbi:hypothetical protein V6N13_094073 [Hibiscus sabdariffa]